MSRVLVLVGSVRRGGNTDLLARAFADGARTAHEVEILSVADLNVHPCLGCNGCYEMEGGRCIQQDDMSAVYEKLRWADTLVLASPVYFYGISAQMKAIVDRLHAPMRNTLGIRHLGLILVGAAELPDLFDPILLQYRMVLRFFGLEDIGTVLARGARDKGDVRSGNGLSQTYELGAGLQELRQEDV